MMVTGGEGPGWALAHTQGSKRPIQTLQWQPSYENQAIMVVDDEPLFCMILASVISACGFTAIRAADGTEALARFDPNCVQLVIADAKMPNLDGMSLIRQIRSLSPGTMLALMTGAADCDQLARGCGADFLLRKPFPLEEVEALLGILTRTPKPMGRA